MKPLSKIGFYLFVGLGALFIVLLFQLNGIAKQKDIEFGFVKDYEGENKLLNYQIKALSDSISKVHERQDSLELQIAKRQVIIENLTQKRNENIKHIDTMSVDGLYQFFSKY